jgi:hypothetical protein
MRRAVGSWLSWELPSNLWLADTSGGRLKAVEWAHDNPTMQRVTMSSPASTGSTDHVLHLLDWHDPILERTQLASDGGDTGGVARKELIEESAQRSRLPPSWG